MWSPASWAPGTRRAKLTVECIYFLVIDIDHVTDEELPSILERIAPFDHIVHASHSDRPGDRCLRVIIRLTRPVLGQEWPRFWRAAMTALGQPADEHTKDASRIYYLPSRPSDAVDPTRTDGTGYRFEFADGYPLDVDAVLALAPPEIASDLTIDDDYVVPEFAGAPSAERIVEASQVLGAAWPAAGADRHGAHLSLAGALARAGWPVELIADFAACVAEVQQPGNADLRKRLTAARSSVEKARSGQAVAGWPTLEDHLGEEPVTRAIELLGLRTGPQHDQDFVDQWAARASRGPGVQAPSGVDVDSALKATQKTLAKRKDPESIRDAEYIKRAMRGVMLTDDASEDRARALAIAAVAIARSVPPNTTPEQVERVLLASAGNLASELPEAVAGALVVARSMPPITARVARNTAPTALAESAVTPDDQFDLDLKTMRPSAGSGRNARLALVKLNVAFRYDLFGDHEIMDRDGRSEIVQDHHIKKLRADIETLFQFAPNKDNFFDMCEVIARENSFHPVLDYLNSLPTDPPLTDDLTSTWLIKFAGAEDTPLTRAISRLMLVAAVRRVRQPGCKFQEMLILETPEQGKGKCLQRGTRVLMYDGSSRVVENVCVGDLLMGPDSKPRRVLETTTGTGPLRKITPVKGASWTCNDQHILTVALHTKDGYHDAPIQDFAPHKWGSYHIPSNKYAMLVRASEIRFAHREVPVDPYLLGAWLGDGTRGVPEITNVEQEIHDYCKSVAEKHGVEYKVRMSNFGVPKIVLSGRERLFGQPQQYHRGNRHPLTKLFKTCVVNDEKRIPKEYLVNDTQTRLEVLAGLIDTDGFLTAGCYEIVTKWTGLRDDILYLARSLGLAAYSRECTKTIKSINFSGQYQRIFISGDIDRVPVKVARKKAAPRRQVKDVLRTGFRVEDVGIGDFVGFELDGDARFLLDDFTITHNSTGLRALVPSDEWFTDDFRLDAGDSRKMIEMTSGHWIIEAGELKGMGQGAAADMKQYLSRQVDKARAAFGRKTARVPRQFVVFGTTNEDEYLKDPTGNRRYWPVRVKEFDVEALRAVRDQIWAEAARLDLDNPEEEFIRLPPSLYAAAAAEQNKRKIADPIMEELSSLLGSAQGRVYRRDIHRVLGYSSDKLPPGGEAMRIAAAMRSLGFKKDRDGSGQRDWFWERGSRTEIKISGTSSGGWHVVPELPVNGSAATTN